MVIVTVVPSLESSFNFHMKSRDATPSEILCLDERQARNENRREKPAGFELMTTILISRCSSRSATTTALKCSNQFFYFWFFFMRKINVKKILLNLISTLGLFHVFPIFKHQKEFFVKNIELKNRALQNLGSTSAIRNHHTTFKA